MTWSKAMSEIISTTELLRQYGSLLDQLRERKIMRTANNPLSDYAEVLFCRAFGWTQMDNSESGHDAVDENGIRYQIKARRLLDAKGSRQLSAIRALDTNPFEHLAGVLVDRNFKVLRAAIVPVEVVRQKSSYVARTNSYRFLLRDDVWGVLGVRDVTPELKAAAETL